jgi:RNA polymerase sigma factor (TIGR02999 family)
VAKRRVSKNLSGCLIPHLGRRILDFHTPTTSGTPVSDVTQILNQIEDGDGQAAEKLLPLVYDELRKLAAARMTKEDPGQTLQATALVHEAYIRLVDVDKAQHWDSRGHFFSAAAEAMRRILVENARRKGSSKRGGDQKRVDLDDVAPISDAATEQILSVDMALERLAHEDPIKAELVKLRCFAGLSHQEAATTLGISRATADRYWGYAKVYLYCEIFEPEDAPPI